jgi:hypothetical protein
MPALYCPLTRMGKNGFRVVDKTTELVIEGYPRSGNSYIEAAFRVSQKPAIRLAHHTHAAANVLRAVQLNKPCYVLIRAPEDACISLVIQEPGVQDLELALQEYERFHRAIAPVVDRICLVPFEVATEDFNAGVVHLNERYDTSFALLPKGIGREQVMARVDAISRERKTVKDGTEPYSPKASEAVRAGRKVEQNRLRTQLRDPALAPLLTRCEATYKELLPRSGLYARFNSLAS